MNGLIMEFESVDVKLNFGIISLEGNLKREENVINALM
jgi:hypothetical protein